ncbi:hypothetical protein MNV49_005742 [Pseudohyphozyma bogoriensis]|nr:hypothetical protein MNV49_005742 [Pseudohyphozyma bogoriensis]
MNMIARLLPVLALLSLLPSTLAVLVQGRVNSSSPLDPNAFVSLASSAETLTTPILHDLSFSLDVPASHYVLKIHNRVSEFASYALFVSSPTDIKAQIYQPGEAAFVLQANAQLPYPLVIPEVKKRGYYDEKPGFNIIKTIRNNPLMLAMGLVGILSLATPALMKRLDPEILAEVQQNQAQMHAKMNSFKNVDVAGGVAKLLAPEQQQAEAAAAKPAGGAASPGGGKARKRK